MNDYRNLYDVFRVVLGFIVCNFSSFRLPIMEDTKVLAYLEKKQKLKEITQKEAKIE
jgi:hypothetical protein